MNSIEIEAEYRHQTKEVIKFVKKHEGLIQRNNEWLNSMGKTIGGSEMSALLGMSKYLTFFGLAERKAKQCVKQYTFTNNVNCEWGNLFEPIITSYIELNFNSKVYGDDICVQVYPGHRNSPDGYIVVKTFEDEEGDLHIKTAEHEDKPTHRVHTLLLEFKCPLVRKPIAGDVPDHYRPQLWSGLSVSPMCDYGLFVDAVFKRCSLSNLNFDNCKYDTRCEYDTPPLALGLICVFVNKMDEEMKTFIKSLTKTKTSKFIDFGTQKIATFEKFLMMIGSKHFIVDDSIISTRTGKGVDMSTTKSINSHLVPHLDDDKFIGFLPWKLFSVEYVSVKNEIDYDEDIAPLIEKLHSLKEESIESGDIEKYFRKLSEPECPDLSVANIDLDDVYSKLGLK